MNNESSLTPTVIIFIVIVAMVGGYIYMKSAGSTIVQPLTASNIASSTTSQFQNVTSQISSISFDTNFFGDPRFAALQSITTPVGQETVGRSDPFAPL